MRARDPSLEFGVVPAAVPGPAPAWIHEIVERFVTGQDAESGGTAGLAWTGSRGRRQVAGFTGVPAKLGAVGQTARRLGARRGTNEAKYRPVGIAGCGAHRRT